MAIEPDDSVRCVSLGRESQSKPWELIFIHTKKSMGWRYAAAVEEQERSQGKKRYQCVLVLEESFFSGDKKLRPLKPPAGFDFSYPVSEPIPIETVDLKGHTELTVRPTATKIPPRASRSETDTSTVVAEEPEEKEVEREIESIDFE